MAAVTIQRTVATIPSAPPTMCDVMLKISSPFVYVGSSLSANFVLVIYKFPPNLVI